MDKANLPTVVLGAGFTGLCATLHLCHHRYPRPIVLIVSQVSIYQDSRVIDHNRNLQLTDRMKIEAGMGFKGI
jgi:NADH dehydrogenase FAD-containing subunit